MILGVGVFILFLEEEEKKSWMKPKEEVNIKTHTLAKYEIKLINKHECNNLKGEVSFTNRKFFKISIVEFEIIFFIEHIKHLFIIFTRINTHMCAAQKLPSNFKIELKTK